MSLREENKNYIKTDNMKSDEFPVNSGLTQGRLLSPTLFNLQPDQTMEETKRKASKLYMGHMMPVYLNECAFADDLCPFISSQSEFIIMKWILVLNTFLIFFLAIDASLFPPKPQEAHNDLETSTKKHLFGKDGILHENTEKFKTNIDSKLNKMKSDVQSAVEKTKSDIEKTKEDIALKIEKDNADLKSKVDKLKNDIKTKPIIDTTAHGRVKILHSEVGMSGGIVIGGNRTGIHFSADANIVGQRARIHGDLLNGHRGHEHSNELVVKEPEGAGIILRQKRTSEEANQHTKNEGFDKSKNLFHKKQDAEGGHKLPENPFKNLQNLLRKKQDSEGGQQLPENPFNKFQNLFRKKQGPEGGQQLPQNPFNKFQNLFHKKQDSEGGQKLPENPFNKLKNLFQKKQNSEGAQKLPENPFNKLKNLFQKKQNSEGGQKLPENPFNKLKILFQKKQDPEKGQKHVENGGSGDILKQKPEVQSVRANEVRIDASNNRESIVQ